MRITIDQNDINEIWASVSGELRLAGDIHSPVMQAAALMISPDDGVQVKCVWAHEGSIKTEWLSTHLLTVNEEPKL